MANLPEEWHVLNVAGTIFQIDADVRKEIESFLKQATFPWQFIIIQTLFDEEVTVIADAVNVIFSSTPEQRSLCRGMARKLDTEAAVE